MPEPREPSPRRHEPAAGRRPSGISRRTFLKGAGTVTAAGLVHGEASAEPELEPRPDEVRRLTGSIELRLTINGEEQKVRAEPRTTLLSALRHRCEPPLTGTKEVCDHGNCGACTVLVDDAPVYACLVLAADAVGKRVRTVEGLAPAGELTPLQHAFHQRDGQMCGFCTPGFVMAGTACLEQAPGADEAEIRRRLAGNLCRCGTYPHVFQAVADAARGGAPGTGDATGGGGGGRR